MILRRLVKYHVTILLTAITIFVSCGSNPKGPTASPVETVIEKRPSIQASELPDAFRKAIDVSSKSSAVDNLKTQNSLTLDGTTLTIGPVGGNRTVSLAFNKLTLINGARIVTNGNHLSIVAMELEFNGSGGIDSFLGETLKASVGADGSDGGQVEIYAINNVTGSLRISLPGQAGGDGAPGAAGSPGLAGPRGQDGVNAAIGCAHGGTDGGPGGTGGTGGEGKAGATGGNGGNLILRGQASSKSHVDQFPYEAPPGIGGIGGAGGSGGPGGPGGEGGSGSTFCGGGHGGPPGATGAKGSAGSNGSNGKSSGARQLLAS